MKLVKYMCVDTSGLLKSDKLQKNIRLENLLLNHTKYLDLTNIVITSDYRYRPLRFAYSIRSCYTNRVIVHNFMRDADKCSTPYDILTGVSETPHKGYDLVMFIGSIAVRNAVRDTDGNLNRLMMKSKFDIRGLYYSGNIEDDPIIFSQIIVDDSAFKEVEKSLCKDYSSASIESFKNPHSKVYKPLLEDLILVKKGVS